MCFCIFWHSFYSASALLAMPTAVRARPFLSVRPSFSLSVRHITFRCFVQMNEATIVRFSAAGRTIPLFSGEVKFIRIFAGDHSQRGRQSASVGPPCVMLPLKPFRLTFIVMLLPFYILHTNTFFHKLT